MPSVGRLAARSRHEVCLTCLIEALEDRVDRREVIGVTAEVETHVRPCESQCLRSRVLVKRIVRRRGLAPPDSQA